MITFTVDLEDPTERYNPEGRYAVMARRILSICDQLQCKATFFTVGKVAHATPALVREIAAQGHEIAYHSHAHVSLTNETPARFEQESRDDKDRLEQLSAKAVTGFRAPRFSLTPQSAWTLDVLAELGFEYSSSIMPTGISRFGFPDASTKAFKWPNGMVEFPLPVAYPTSFRIPYLGGIYLYTMPSFISRHWARQARAGEVLWTYTHPYDFDRESKFASMPNTPLWVSLVLWNARRMAEKRLRNVLKLGIAPPLGQRLREV